MDIRFTQDSIFHMDTESIIYFTENSLIGPTTNCLIEKSGNDIMDSLIKLGGCPTGYAKIIPAYNLNCKYVILSVIPEKINNRDDEEIFIEAIENILKIMCKYNIESTAVDVSYILEMYGKDYITIFNKAINKERYSFSDLTMYLCRGRIIDR